MPPLVQGEVPADESSEPHETPDGLPSSGAPRVLVVSLAGVHLAIPAALAAGVVRPGPVTPVPGPEPWVLGVTAVRGRVLPVVDVRRLAGLGPAEGAEEAAGDASGAWFVVIDDGRRAAVLAGMRVRRVAACVADRDAEPAGAAAAAGLPTCGVARLEGENSRGADALPPTAPLLDVAALLDLVHDPTGAQP